MQSSHILSLAVVERRRVQAFAIAFVMLKYALKYSWKYSFSTYPALSPTKIDFRPIIAISMWFKIKVSLSFKRSWKKLRPFPHCCLIKTGNLLVFLVIFKGKLVIKWWENTAASYFVGKKSSVSSSFSCFLFLALFCKSASVFLPENTI